MPCRAISFDLDGTLVETADEIARAVNLTLLDFDLAPRPPAEIEQLIGDGLRALMIKLLARILMAQPARVERLDTDALLARLDAHYAAVVGSTARAYPGVREALQDLHDAGLPLACVTNKEGRHAQRVLDAAGLSDLIDVLVAGDTLAHKKPHRSVLITTAQLLKVKPGALAHVGDSRTDIEAARNAGVAAWAVPYGYNGGEPVALARPQRLFAQIADVARHVLGGCGPVHEPARALH